MPSTVFADGLSSQYNKKCQGILDTPIYTLIFTGCSIINDTEELPLSFTIYRDLYKILKIWEFVSL